MWAFLPTLLFKVLWGGRHKDTMPFSKTSEFSTDRMGSENLCLNPDPISLCLQAKGLCSFSMDLGVYLLISLTRDPANYLFVRGSRPSGTLEVMWNITANPNIYRAKERLGCVHEDSCLSPGQGVTPLLSDKEPLWKEGKCQLRKSLHNSAFLIGADWSVSFQATCVSKNTVCIWKLYSSNST